MQTEAIAPLWKKPKSQYRGLWYFGVWFCGLGALLTASLLFLDPRILSGEPLWLKPLKFMISSIVFALTLDWGLRFLQDAGRWGELAKRIVVYGMYFELVIICGQAARGVKSHFNFTTIYDGLLFSMMGFVITAVVLATLYLAWLIFRKAKLPQIWREAYLLGFIIFAFAGFSSGFIMPNPTPDQIELLQSGDAVAAIGSHFVGSFEGQTETLFLTGWSLEAGDLRVSHFIGLHVVQLLLGFVILTRGPKSFRQKESPLNRMVLWCLRLLALMSFLLVSSSLGQALSAKTFFGISGFWGLVNVLIILSILGILTLGYLNKDWTYSEV